MNNNFYTRLLRIALFSSPILALYGITPVYLFNKVPPSFLLFAGMGIMVNVLLYWFVNIWLIKRTYKKRKVVIWYIFSYLFVFFSQAVLTFIRDRVAPPLLIDMEMHIDKITLLTYPLMSILAINTIILIICNAVIASQKNKNAAFEIEQLKVNNLEAQTKVLMQQLQPHFLFNALSVLKSLIKENPDEAENYAVKLSEFLRYTLQVNNSTIVSVEDELKFTKDYIELQKVRFGNSFLCTINIPASIYKSKLPAYALQTLVENAIKHNLFTEKNALQVTIEYKDNQISVYNNKLLLKPTDGTGTGLKNLNDRYKIIANKEIEIINNNLGFCVKVDLLNNE
jgi:two-component system, LytTR family, sensor kinase